MNGKNGILTRNDIGNDSEFSHISLTDEREHSKAALKASNHSHDVPPAPLSSGALGTRWAGVFLGRGIAPFRVHGLASKELQDVP